MPELPPPLPPDQRTVGQLIAESIRAYGAHFWLLVPTGAALAIADQFAVRHTLGAQMVVFWAATPLFVAAYVWTCRVVLNAEITREAVILAVVIWIVFAPLRALYILPAVALLAFVGLAVPAAMVERLGLRDAFTRGRKLGRADYLHAAGSIAALVIVVGVAETALEALLHTQGNTGRRVALGLSDLVLSPLLFIGGAILYVDQAARAVGSRHADLHPPVDADSARRPDPQVEP